MHKCIMVKVGGKRNTRKVCKKQVNLSKTGGKFVKVGGKGHIPPIFDSLHWLKRTRTNPLQSSSKYTPSPHIYAKSAPYIQSTLSDHPPFSAFFNSQSI